MASPRFSILGKILFCASLNIGVTLWRPKIFCIIQLLLSLWVWYSFRLKWKWSLVFNKSWYFEFGSRAIIIQIKWTLWTETPKQRLTTGSRYNIAVGVVLVLICCSDFTSTELTIISTDKVNKWQERCILQCIFSAVRIYNILSCLMLVVRGAGIRLLSICNNYRGCCWSTR